MKTEPLTKEFIDEEMKKGSMFLLEKHLDGLPLDWIDCLMFIHTCGMNNDPGFTLMIIDGDEEFKKLNDLSKKDEIKLIIFNKEESKVWSLFLFKHENERWFLGGENLRLFCDARNIFYKSNFVENGSLISGTNMAFQKKNDENCRDPENVH